MTYKDVRDNMLEEGSIDLKSKTANILTHSLYEMV